RAGARIAMVRPHTDDRGRALLEVSRPQAVRGRETEPRFRPRWVGSPCERGEAVMRASSVAPWRTLAVLCLATAGWAFNFGVAAQAITLWLSAAGCSDVVIGCNTGTYYLGIILGAP